MTFADPTPRISVIIPVYRDWDDLRRCLTALSQQSWPASDFEILVVNNDEGSAPADLSAPNLRLLQEPQGHSYAARNAGIAAARGAVLAFTDADCSPEPEWLRAGWAALQDPATDLAGGHIRNITEGPGLIAEYDRLLAFQQERYVQHGTSVTANLFIKRAVFERTGPFNGEMQSGGDFEFCRRARKAGFRLVYASQASVRHPARDKLTALLRKNRRVASGFRRLEFELPGRSRADLLRTVLFTMLRPRPYYWWRLAVGRECTGGLPLARRLGVMTVAILLHYHFAFSVLRTPPAKNAH